LASNYPNIKIATIWHPYMIDPATKANGEKYMDYNVRRWGGGNYANNKIII